MVSILTEILNALINKNISHFQCQCIFNIGFLTKIYNSWQSYAKTTLDHTETNQLRYALTQNECWWSLSETCPKEWLEQIVAKYWIIFSKGYNYRVSPYIFCSNNHSLLFNGYEVCQKFKTDIQYSPTRSDARPCLTRNFILEKELSGAHTMRNTQTDIQSHAATYIVRLASIINEIFPELFQFRRMTGKVFLKYVKWKFIRRLPIFRRTEDL